MLALLLLSSAAAGEEAVAGPDSMLADGSSRATFVWRTHLDAARASASITAGSVTALRDAGPGKIEVDVRAPNLAESERATLELSDAAGKVLRRRTIQLVREVPALVEQRSSGPYQLSAPESMLLGGHEEAILRFKAEPAEGVQLFTNAGEIGKPKPAGDGYWEARYVPPRQKYPQLAIVAAIGTDRQRIDWLSIPLLGRPEVTTRSEPLSVVFVDVEKRRYGPLRTNHRGEAHLRVWVPPGVSRATTLARDALGNQRSAPLDLGVPAFSRQLVTCSDATPLLTVVSVSPAGEPLSVPDFSVETSLGSVSEMQRRQSGVFDLGLRVPVDAVTGTPVRVSTQPRREGQPGSVCDTRVAGELPSSVRLSPDRNAYVAGGEAVELLIELSFPGRREAGEARLIFAPSSGGVSDVRRTSPTQYRASFRPDDAFGDATRASVSVRLEGTDVAASTEVALEAGQPKSVVAEMDRAQLEADGASTAELRVTLRDAGGNLTDAVAPTARATGQVSAFERTAPGSYRAIYTAPPSSRAEGDRIVVRAGQASTSQSVDLSGMDRPFLASARVGYFTNFGRISVLTFAASGAMRLGFDRRLALGLNLGYYQQESGVPDNTGAIVQVEISSAPISAQAIYEVPLGVIVPYVGAGAGLVVNWTELRGEVVSSQSVIVRPTLSVLGGLTLPLRSGTTLLGGLMGQAQYAYVKKVEDGSVIGKLGGLDVTAGYQYEF